VSSSVGGGETALACGSAPHCAARTERVPAGHEIPGHRLRLMSESRRVVLFRSPRLARGVTRARPDAPPVETQRRQTDPRARVGELAHHRRFHAPTIERVRRGNHRSARLGRRACDEDPLEITLQRRRRNRHRPLLLLHASSPFPASSPRFPRKRRQARAARRSRAKWRAAGASPRRDPLVFPAGPACPGGPRWVWRVT
jgi:hypothetical protein